MKKVTLGLVLGNINPDFEYDVTHGVNKYAKEKGINIITLVSTSNKNNEQLTDKIFESYRFLGIDGLIIIYGSLLSFKKSANGQNFLDKFKDIPYIIVQDNYHIPGKSNLIVDNKDGMLKCVNHLIEDHKCKNILYFSGPKENHDSEERLNAYKEAMETHNLKVTSSMIAYGDFSDDITHELKLLLRRNKKIDAIAFANDTMALASYQILEQYGYKIGKDILITGFDDMYKSSIAHPALTTVSQDPVRIGYESTKEVYNMVINKNCKYITLDTNLILRKSCGCRKENRTSEDLRNLSEDELINYFIKESSLNSKSNINFKLLKSISKNVLKKIKSEYTVDEIVYYIKNAIIKDEESAISNYDDIFAYFCLAMKKYINFTTDIRLKEKTSAIFYNLQTWYFSYITNEIVSENKQRLNRITNISLICRKMINDQLSKSEMFANVFVELKEIGVKSSYIYLFDNDNNTKAHLCAYFNDKVTKIYRSNEKREKIIPEKFVSQSNGTFSYGFSLSSNEKYYGFIVCETDLSLINSIKLLCSQIGTLLYVDEIRKRELKAQIELKKSLRLIQEKNEILNNLSLYDELTRIYNRRGFIEKSLEVIKENIGKEIEVVFCDLDHLKEINDTFGHKEGDYAISTSAGLIESSLPKNAIVARLGGDEFVALHVNLAAKDNISTEEKIRSCFSNFNESCEKPYYIETSVGTYTFIGKDNTKITNILDEADKYLYKAKKHRRKSVKK